MTTNKKSKLNLGIVVGLLGLISGIFLIFQGVWFIGLFGSIASAGLAFKGYLDSKDDQ
jgi:uncharacterized membrane protein